MQFKGFTLRVVSLRTHHDYCEQLAYAYKKKKTPSIYIYVVSSPDFACDVIQAVILRKSPTTCRLTARAIFLLHMQMNHLG